MCTGIKMCVKFSLEVVFSELSLRRLHTSPVYVCVYENIQWWACFHLSDAWDAKGITLCLCPELSHANIHSIHSERKRTKIRINMPVVHKIVDIHFTRHIIFNRVVSSTLHIVCIWMQLFCRTATILDIISIFRLKISAFHVVFDFSIFVYICHLCVPSHAMHMIVCVHLYVYRLWFSYGRSYSDCPIRFPRISVTVVYRRHHDQIT